MTTILHGRGGHLEVTMEQTMTENDKSELLFENETAIKHERGGMNGCRNGPPKGYKLPPNKGHQLREKRLVAIVHSLGPGVCKPTDVYVQAGGSMFTITRRLVRLKNKGLINGANPHKHWTFWPLEEQE